MGYSAKLHYEKRRIKKDGTATLYIQVIVASEKDYINLDIAWRADLIDTEHNQILPRSRPDKEHQDYMLIIKREFGKVNEIFRLARLGERSISLSEFKQEYKYFESREDFVLFWQRTLDDRASKGIIRGSTVKAHQSSLNTLIEFSPKLPFNQITKKFLDDYKAFMFNRKNYDSDTALTKLKNLRTYLNIAKESGFQFVYPFKGFKMPAEQRRIEYLNEDEFILLKTYFEQGHHEVNSSKGKSLRAFMFMCYTGVRLGDIQQLTHANIKKGILEFEPQKNTKDMQKTVEIPLHPEASKLIITQKGKLFALPSDTKIRSSLSEIAAKLGINSTCSPHVARHTFATRFLRKGGRLEVLKELLGHEDIKTTLIYVHVDLERKKHEISMLD